MQIKLKPGDAILVKDLRRLIMDSHGWTTATFKGINKKAGKIETEMKQYTYFIPLNEFNPYDMNETKRHIYHIKNGNIEPLYTD